MSETTGRNLLKFAGLKLLDTLYMYLVMEPKVGRATLDFPLHLAVQCIYKIFNFHKPLL